MSGSHEAGVARVVGAASAGQASPPLVTGALADALERGQSRFNASVSAVRRGTPRFSVDRLTTHLVCAVQPVVDAVAAASPDRVERVVEALFDLSVLLVARGWPGSGGVQAAAWARVLAAAPHLVASAPDTMARAVTNAVFNIAREPGARAAEWIERMSLAGATCTTVGEWLSCGTFCAWTAGLAHLRDAALRELEHMPTHRAHAVLGLLASTAGRPVAQWVRALRDDPWLPPSAVDGPAPERTLRVVASPGGFIGFGGPFIGPPDVVRAQGRFVVFDARVARTLFADACGATLTPTVSPRDFEEPADSGVFVGSNGQVTLGGRRALFPELAETSSVAASRDTLVVAVPRSHHVFVIALAPASA